MNSTVSALAVKVDRWRKRLGLAVLVLSAAVVLSRFVSVPWYVPRPVEFVLLFATLFVISWCLGLWSFADAFHPTRGWLRAEGKVALHLPGLRVIFLAALGGVLALPVIMAIVALLTLN